MVYNRAERRGRVPGESKAVLDEVVQKLSTCIMETTFQRRERATREQQAIQHGRSHADFRINFEVLLEHMEEAGVYDEDNVICIDQMFHLYLNKTPEQLRSCLLAKTHPLDGAD